MITATFRYGSPKSLIYRYGLRPRSMFKVQLSPILDEQIDSVYCYSLVHNLVIFTLGQRTQSLWMFAYVGGSKVKPVLLKVS